MEASIGTLLFPFYVILVFGSTLCLSLNQKRFRKILKIDSLFVFMIIYLGNFVFTSIYFRSMNKYFRVGLPTVLMFISIYLLGRFQIIGLTGNIACGKSTVSEYFKKTLQIPVIDCDLLARRVVESGKPAYKKIVKYFGDSVLLQDGSNGIDRKVLGEIVFSNSKHRKFLTRMTGFYICLEIFKEIYRLCIRQKYQIVVLDAALLFESKYLTYLCYPIVTIYVQDEQKQIDRIVLRDKIDEEQARKRVTSQMPQNIKIQKADIAIANDGTVPQLMRAVGVRLADFLI